MYLSETLDWMAYVPIFVAIIAAEGYRCLLASLRKFVSIFSKATLQTHLKISDRFTCVFRERVFADWCNCFPHRIEGKLLEVNGKLL